jgi:hypothetical protein
LRDLSLRREQASREACGVHVEQRERVIEASFASSRLRGA